MTNMLDSIAERHRQRAESGMVGGVREWFDIAYLLNRVVQAEATNHEMGEGMDRMTKRLESVLNIAYEKRKSAEALRASAKSAAFSETSIRQISEAVSLESQADELLKALEFIK